MIGISVINFARAFFFFSACIVIIWAAYEAINGTITKEFAKAALVIFVSCVIGVAITSAVKMIFMRISQSRGHNF